MGRPVSKRRTATDDVFGVSRDLPLNYVARETIDGGLVEALTRSKHVVIHGSSKQGKTSLRKSNLRESEYIHVACQNKWTVSELHAAILKRAGFQVEQSTATTVGGERKIHAKATGKFSAKLLGQGGEAGAEVGAERKTNDASTITTVPLELDPADPNDVIAALETIDFDRFIVLEDFHYLSPETQADFAVALKAFHEDSNLIFVVVGVWLDSNRLVQHNGDLTGRVVTVNADAWKTDELHEVIRAGEKLLGIRFADSFKSELVAGCFESVWVVQEGCHLACKRQGIMFSQDEVVVVGEGVDVPALIEEVVASQSDRYNGFLEHFPGGYQSAPTELEMYRWLLLPVLSVPLEKLERGLSVSDLREMVNRHHPRAPLNDMNFLQALRRTSGLQVQQKTKPIILDYDQTNRRLTVVDRGFLIWLQHQDRQALLRQIELPDSEVVLAT